MPSFKSRIRSATLCMAAFSTFLADPAHASNDALGGTDTEFVSARFDQATHQTRIAGHVTPNLCVSLALPQEWQLETTEELKTNLKAASGGAELELSIRSARDLQDLPQPDLPSRDAAYLQRDYEDTLGRPAQAVSLATVSSGARRWTATWVDGNLPTASHALTVETFIVPLSRDWLLELSLDNVEPRGTYDALMQQVLASLTVKARCA